MLTDIGCSPRPTIPAHKASYINMTNIDKNRFGCCFFASIPQYARFLRHSVFIYYAYCWYLDGPTRMDWFGGRHSAAFIKTNLMNVATAVPSWQHYKHCL